MDFLGCLQADRQKKAETHERDCFDKNVEVDTRKMRGNPRSGLEERNKQLVKVNDANKYKVNDEWVNGTIMGRAWNAA